MRYGENGKQSFAIMSSGRLAMQGRSSCRLGREQVMMAKDKQR